MADLAEVRSKRGLHYDFQFGHKNVNTYRKFTWPEPHYNGCAVRAFFFSGENPAGGIDVRYSKWYYVNPTIENGKVYNNFSNDFTYGKTGPKQGVNVEKNTYFSLGAIFDDRYMGFMFGNKVLERHNMHSTLGWKWTITLQEGSMILTSFHIYDEVGRHFPANGLGNVYVGENHSGFFLSPIGTRVTVELLYKNNPNTTMAIRMENNGPEAKYTGVPLNMNDPFTVIIDNTIKGWNVTVSFGGPNQTPKLIPRNSIDYYTRPVFTNSSVIRILAVCAPTPPRHRH